MSAHVAKTSIHFTLDKQPQYEVWWPLDQAVHVEALVGTIYFVLLDKTLNSHSASFHPGILVGTHDKLLGKTLQWTSIPSRRSRNTPSCFINWDKLWPGGLLGYYGLLCKHFSPFHTD